MKTLKEYIENINESISGQDLEDLKACVKVSMDEIVFEYDSREKMIKELEAVEKGNDKLSLTQKVIDHFRDTYDFDTKDPEVLGAIKDMMKEHATKLIKDFTITLKYSK